MLALVHQACGEDLGVSVATLAEEDTCAPGAGSSGDCSLDLRQLRGEQLAADLDESADGSRDRELLDAAAEGEVAEEVTQDEEEDAGAEAPDQEAGEGPDVAVLSEMSASERAALLSDAAESAGRIDMIWPGSGYAGVLDGGIWQAAKFDHGYTIDAIIGSSGGAASAFLCLVDEAHGTDRSLTTYKRVYNDYKQASVIGWASSTTGCNTNPGDDDACWWYYNYKKVLDSSAFANVRSKLKVSMYCKNTGLTVLYNFKSTEQVAQALAAAGNGAVGKYFKVDSINDWCQDYDTSAQGYGFPSKFNPQKLPVWYYNNGPFTGASSVTCADGTSILSAGYTCVDYAIGLGKQQWANTNYLWRPGSHSSSISNDFSYSTGPATWMER